MRQHPDAESEVVIHSDETHISSLASDDAEQLRSEVESAHAAEVGELPA